MAYDFEKFKKDIKKTSEKVGVKAKELSDTAKLKVDIKSKEHELDKLYCALGKVYFTAHQNDDEESLPEAVMFRGIKRAEEELAQLNKELAGENGGKAEENTVEIKAEEATAVDDDAAEVNDVVKAADDAAEVNDAAKAADDAAEVNNTAEADKSDDVTA